jgi:hypothetical protein
VVILLRCERISGGRLRYVYSVRTGATVTFTVMPGPAMLPPMSPVLVAMAEQACEVPDVASGAGP